MGVTSLIEKILFLLNKLHPPKADFLSIAYEKEGPVVIGGTFDRLHVGHEAFISTAFEIAPEIHVCVMSDEGVKVWGRGKKGIEKIEPFWVRIRRIVNFIKEHGLLGKAKIARIDDPFSYALTSRWARRLQSILVSAEHLVVERTERLNELREQRSLQPLKIYKMELIVDESGRVISSSRLRTKGVWLLDYLKTAPRLILPEKLRKELSRPLGELAKNVRELPEPERVVVAVGDYVLKELSENQYPVSVGIMDKKTRREEIMNYTILMGYEDGVTRVPPHIPVLNERGTLSPEVWLKMAIAFVQPKPVILRVYGEEDLLGLAVLAMAPKGTLMIYGQPPPVNAMVYVFVEDEVREWALDVIARMSG